MKKILIILSIFLLTMTIAPAAAEDRVLLQCLDDTDCATDFVCNQGRCLAEIHEIDMCSKEYITDFCNRECLVRDKVPLGPIQEANSCFEECVDATLIKNQCVEPDKPVPEFSVVALLAAAGLAGIFIYKRRK